MQAGSLLLRALLIAPYPEMLPLARLQETPTPRAGEPYPQPRHTLQCPVPPWLCSPALRWQRDGCQGWQAEGKAQVVWLGLTWRGAELLQPAPGGEESILSSPGTTPHVVRPAGLQVPHVPRQTLTAPWWGRQHGQQQHPATMVLSTRLALPLRPALAALRWAAPRQRRGLSTPTGPGHTLDLGGIFPPLATPFSPTQEVDYAQLEGNLRRYASIPFRGKRCPPPLSVQAPARSLPAAGAVRQLAGSLPASRGCSASSRTLLQGWQPLG